MGGYARTALLMAALTALFVALGYALGGAGGMLVAFLIAAATNLFAWWNSDAVVLRMHNAVPIGPEVHPRLYRLTAALAQRAALPMPALYVIEEDQPNAFATGRSPERAAVAVTAGLLNTMPEEELAGVIAHELAHIRNRDTLVMTVTACLAGAIGMIAQFGGLFGGRDRNSPFGAIGLILLIILAPLAAMLVQMAISRSREYEADRVGSAIAGSPAGLANALRRLESYRHQLVNGAAEANPATAHLFIINPLSGARFDNLFSTHPSTEHRLAALAQLGGGDGGAPFGGSAAPRAPRPWDRFTNRAAAPRRGPWG
ncbi:zinc metalloprotease HtpX [Roseomonas sp. CCTCC AB2023176]|uniref:zinc metalloprotease HtpX n=1 Tax=Roseomonas sp. CCTCC AB2023176 TaxID=3342640 RepID=UPI0035D6E17C